MTGVTVSRRNRLHISVLVASSMALLLLAIAAGTAVGHASIRLTNPVVSPSVATAGTSISFSVTFTDANGAAPNSVSVLIDGNPIGMTGDGPDYAAGVRFSATASPAVGTHEIHFRGVDSNGHVDEVAAPNLVINPASTTDSGSYAVVVSNSIGSVTSRVSTVTVHADTSKPVVTITSPAA